MEADTDAPSSRSGLSNLYKQASQASQLLVVSRISNQKVLPWMVSPTGAIRCFDTVSLSQKLSLHRHTRMPIILHVFLWDKSANYANVGSIRARAMSTSTPSSHAEVHLVGCAPNLNQVMPLAIEDDFDDDDYDENRDDSHGTASDGPEIMLERDTAGEFSFRLHDFALKNNWV